MGVRKIKKSWWVDIRYKYKRYRLRSPINTKDGARDYESLLRQKLMRGESIEREQTKNKEQLYSEFTKSWFEGYVVINNKHSEILSKQYILQKHLVPYFGKTAVDKISNYQIEQFKVQKLKDGYTKKTINNQLAVLRRSLGSANEWLGLDPIPKVKLFKVPPQKFDFLSREEGELLLKHADEFWHDMILVALRTGLRLGELIALDWADIDFENKILAVRHAIVRNIKGSPKSNKIRYIPLTAGVLSALAKRKQKSGYIFTHRGKFLKTDFCSSGLARICERAGLRQIGWHKLRHSFASHLVGAGATIKAIQELLGHSDIQTTMRYAHLAPSALQNTVNLLEPDYFGQPVGNQYKFINLEKSSVQLILPEVKQKQDVNPAL